MGIMSRYYYFPMCTRPFIFADHYIEAVSAIKLLQYVIDNLNLKG